RLGRCSSSRRKAAASSSVRVRSSIFFMRPILLLSIVHGFSPFYDTSRAPASVAFEFPRPTLEVSPHHGSHKHQGPASQNLRRRSGRSASSVLPAARLARVTRRGTHRRPRRRQGGGRDVRSR